MRAVPKKWLTVPLLFMMGGLALVLAAIFAERLGIDPSAGWGRGRVVLLVTGLLITAVASLAWTAPHKATAIEQRIQRRLRRLPGIERIKEAAWSARARDALKNYWVAIPVCLLVSVIYVWLVSSGTWTTWASPTRHYMELARALEQGHLYLPVKVPPALLTSPDPYEPLGPGVTQGPVDLAYFKGKLYLPWGPFPALVILLFRGLFHWWLGDLQLTFVFLCGLLLVQCLLLVLLWDRHFRDLPRRLLWLSMLLIGLAGPASFMLSSYLAASVYEAAIAGGQFLLVCGLLMGVVALDGARRTWALGLAGAFWAMAVASRFDLALPVGVMVLMVSVRVLQVNRERSGTIGSLALLYGPLALGAALLAWYNWARFGSVAETGYYYALAGIMNVHKHWNDQFSPAYILPNLYAYLIHPIQAKAAYPFFDVSPANTPGPSALQPAFPAYYFSQRITAVPWLAPFVFLAVIPIARALLNRFHGKRAGAPEDSETSDMLGWLHITLAASGLITLLFLLVFFWSAMRYIEDFLPCLMLLSILGFWEGYQSLRRDLRKAQVYAGLGVFLAGASISISMLAGISVNEARFGLMSLLAVFGH